MNASCSRLRRSVSLALGLMACTGSGLWGSVQYAHAAQETAAAPPVRTISPTPMPVPRPWQYRSATPSTPSATAANKSPGRKFNDKGSGTLTAMLPGGKQLGHCPLKHTDVKASISGHVSRVSVKQTFSNPYKDKIEAIYTFPLPENAAVDEMTMRIGTRVIKGNIKKKEEARQIYNDAKNTGHVASLLDQERPNIFTQSVANIEPGEQVEIEIKYVDLLPYESGKFTFAFPTVVGPRFMPGNPTGSQGTGREPDTDGVPDASKISPPVAEEGQRAGHDISISLDIDAGVSLSNVESKLHEVRVEADGETKSHVTLADKDTIPNKDFVLTWDVAGDQLKSGHLTHHDGDSGYFSLMLLPPKRVTVENVAPKEMVFLLDCSGSQSGPPLQKAKETMNYVVDHLNPNDTFQIISFSDHLLQFAERPQKVTAETKARAKAFVRKLEANGSTWMAPAVEKACAMSQDQNRLRIVAFMTDGYVGNDMEVIGMVKRYRGKSRWFPFGTGDSVNRFLIDGIAKEGGGEPEYVLLNSPGAVVGKKFYDRISSPVLTDVKVDFTGVEVKEVFPKEVSDVWAERPLYIKGRYLKPGAGTITLTGFAAGQPYRQELSVVFPEKQSANEVIKPVWARAKVDRLMSQDWIAARTGHVNPELQNEITKTALDYHIMTQYTSFVAVEEATVTKPGTNETIVVPVEMPNGVSREMTISEQSSLQSPLSRGCYGMAAPKCMIPKVMFKSSAGPRSSPAPRIAGSYAGSKKDAQIITASPIAGVFIGTAADSTPAESKANAAQEKGKTTGKLDSTLAALKLASASNPTATVPGAQLQNGKVSVKVTFASLNAQVLTRLKQLGFVVATTSKFTVTGRIAPKLLAQLEAMTEVVRIESASIKV